MKPVQLGDVATFIRGITFKPDDIVELGTDGSVACLRTKNVQADLDLSDVWAVSRNFVKSDEKLTKPGDIILSTANSWNLVGKASWIPELPWPTTAGGFVSLLRANPEKVSPRYLYHWLTTDEVQANLRKCARQTTNISNLNIQQAAALRIPLPPLPEQKRIAGILDQADALRRLRARALEKLNTLGQAIFHEMFDEVLDSRDTILLGELTSKIGSGATPRGGDAAYKNEGIPLIRSMNVRDGAFSTKGLAFIDDDQAAKLDNVTVKAKDVLLNITGASVARVCIAPENTDSARVNQHVSIIRCTENLLPEFLEAFLLLPRIKAKLLKIAEGGATRQAITKMQIQNFEIPRVELAAQNAFMERRRAVAAQQGYVLRQAASIDSLFASLQHRAFRGEL